MGTQQIKWTAIAECNGIYYISNHGQVKSYKYGKERILKRVITPKGYWKIDIWLNGKSRSITIHKLVALAFVSNPDNKPQVNHKDGDKLNNDFTNLEWVTPQENIQHAWQNGLCESSRLAIIQYQSKPVIDCTTGKKYNSLKLACIDIGEPYSRHQKRHFIKSKLQRFFYL